jgi:hypothetical protein
METSHEIRPSNSRLSAFHGDKTTIIRLADAAPSARMPAELCRAVLRSPTRRD